MNTPPFYRPIQQAYFVTCDVTEGQDYTTLYEYLNSIGTRVPQLDNTWLVTADPTALLLASVKEHTYQGDDINVTPVFPR